MSGMCTFGWMVGWKGAMPKSSHHRGLARCHVKGKKQWSGGAPAARSCSHTATDAPESLRSCLGNLADRVAPWENKVCMGPATPTQRRVHPSASGPAWAAWGIGMPRGDGEYTRSTHSHTAADTPKSLRSCLGRLGDSDTPWENEDTQGPAISTQQRIQLSPFGSTWAAWGIGTPRGRARIHKVQPLPHSGGYTRVLLVLPGPLGE